MSVLATFDAAIFNVNESNNNKKKFCLAAKNFNLNGNAEI